MEGRNKGRRERPEVCSGHTQTGENNKKTRYWDKNVKR